MRLKSKYSLFSTFFIIASFAVSARSQDPPINTVLVGAWDNYAGAYADVWGDGDFAYVGHYGDAGVHIIDISNPSVPTLAAHYRVASPNNSASAQDVKVHDGLMFVGLESGSPDQAEIVDVRDPYSPQLLCTISLDNFSSQIHNVFYDNGYLYLVDSESPQVAIVDLTGFDPDFPPSSITSSLWILSGVGNSLVHDVTVENGRLYAAAWDSGLKIYNVSDIANQPPQLIGETPDAGNNTHSCWPTSDGNFVVTGEERQGGGIKVYRITDDGVSLTLELTDELALDPGESYSVHNQLIDGYRLYCSWYQAGIKVFDIDPTTGLLDFVASYDTYAGNPSGFDGAWGVYPFLGDQRILISDLSTGLYIVALTLNPVPTLSQWGMLIMGLLLLVLGTVAVVKKRKGVLSRAS